MLWARGALRDHLTHLLISSTKAQRGQNLGGHSQPVAGGSRKLKARQCVWLPVLMSLLHRDLSWLAPELHRCEGQFTGRDLPFPM